jgi:hypothetical protein
MAGAAQRHAMRAALHLVGDGLAVFPLQPGSETPVRSVDWQIRATRDPQTVREWWSIAPFNVGVLTGSPSSLLVVSLRAPARIGLPHGLQVLTRLAHEAGAEAPTDTRTVTSPRGDHHLYFRLPTDAHLGSTDAALGIHIDTRGEGGYVVGPGSTVSRRPYKVVCAADPQPVPAWLLTPLQGTALESHAAGSKRALSGASERELSDYVSRVVGTEANRVATAPITTRRATLLRAATTLGRLVVEQRLSETVAHAALMTACNEHRGTNTLSPHVIDATIQSGLRRAQRPQAPGTAPSGPHVERRR